LSRVVVVLLQIVERVGCAELGEALEEVKGHTPFSGVRDAWDAEGVGSADVADKRLSVCEGDDVTCGNNVMYTD
jgi:hypothetical protein